MAFTVDYTTDIGKVRLLLSDVDSTNPIFPDDQQIQTLLNLELGDIKQACALGLETIAGNRAMIQKVSQLLDLKTDGKSTAQGLLAVAKQHRDNSNLDWAGFDIAEVVDNSDFVFREHYLKLLLQSASGGPPGPGAF
jgi:hypothetical protein